MTDMMHYPRMGWRDMRTFVQDAQRRLDLPAETRRQQKAWQEATQQYMFTTAATSPDGAHLRLAEGDRGTVVVDEDALLKFRVYHTLEVSASGLLPRNMDTYAWDHNYITDDTAAFQIDVRMLGRGSILMNYYDVIRGEQVEGYGSDFVAMTEQIEARMWAETKLMPRRFAARAFLTNLLYLGNLTRSVAPGYDVLFKSAALRLDATVTRDMLLTGELQSYFQSGVPLNMVADLLGAHA